MSTTIAPSSATASAAAGGGAVIARAASVCLNQNARLDLGDGESLYAICILQFFIPVCTLHIAT
jgi:hypothetical protein